MKGQMEVSWVRKILCLSNICIKSSLAGPLTEVKEAKG